MGKKKNNSLRNWQQEGSKYGVPDDIAKLRKELVKPVRETRKENGRKFKNSDSGSRNSNSSFDRKSSRY